MKLSRPLFFWEQKWWHERNRCIDLLSTALLRFRGHCLRGATMGHDCPLNAFANDVKDAFFLSSSFHWHPLSRQASYCVSEVPWQGCHACRSWGVSLPGVGEGGKAPCSEVTSQTRQLWAGTTFQSEGAHSFALTEAAEQSDSAQKRELKAIFEGLQV